MITITSDPHFTLALSISHSLSVSVLFWKRKSINCLFPQRHLNWITRLIITILNHYRATISRVYLGQFNLFFPIYRIHSHSWFLMKSCSFLFWYSWLFCDILCMISAPVQKSSSLTNYTHNNRSLYITWRMKLW